MLFIYNVYQKPLIGVKGRLQSRDYETEDIRRHIVELVAEKITFLSSKNKDN